MTWLRKGLILSAPKTSWWNQRYAMMPVPLYLEDLGVLRVFYGTTDDEIFGRTAYVDLDPQDPFTIVSSSTDFVLDLGEAGCFDDCGAVPSSIVKYNGEYRLYYVGFQRTVKVPYMLFSGLAVSPSMKDVQFSRHSQAPVIDRSGHNYVSNAAPFVIYDENEQIFKMWFWVGSAWVVVNNKKYIRAEIHYSSSQDGYAWSPSVLCVAPEEHRDEFSVGRPWVLKHADGFEMYYSTRFREKLYRISRATSADGIKWEKQGFSDFDVSQAGWDSEMTCYASVVQVGDRKYMFYNGNNNGETGFGFAEWKQD